MSLEKSVLLLKHLRGFNVSNHASDFFFIVVFAGPGDLFMCILVKINDRTQFHLFLFKRLQRYIRTDTKPAQISPHFKFSMTCLTFQQRLLPCLILSLTNALMCQIWW